MNKYRAPTTMSNFCRTAKFLATVSILCACLSLISFRVLATPAADRWQSISDVVSNTSQCQSSSPIPLRAPSSQARIPDWAWLLFVALVGLAGFAGGWILSKRRARANSAADTDSRPRTQNREPAAQTGQMDDETLALERQQGPSSATPPEPLSGKSSKDSQIREIDPDQDSADAPAYLESNDGTRFALRSASVGIGREADNEIVLDDLSVSRHHAEVNRDPNGEFSINDLSSLNGVFVNGQKVDAADLSHDDKLEVGDVRLRFKLAEPAAANGGVGMAASVAAVHEASSNDDFEFQRTLVWDESQEATAERAPAMGLEDPEATTTEHARTLVIAPPEASAETLDALDFELISDDESLEDTHQRTLVLGRPGTSDKENSD